MRLSVCCAQVVSTGNGQGLLLWEKWTAEAYVSTHMRHINMQTGAYWEDITLPSSIRLCRRDDMLFYRGRAVSVQGNQKAQQITLNLFELRR